METQTISIERAKKESPEKLLEMLSTSNQGLSSEESRRRLALFGPNALEEKRVSPLRKFLGYFWGPIPWMIEVAAILSAVVRH